MAGCLGHHVLQLEACTSMVVHGTINSVRTVLATLAVTAAATSQRNVLLTTLVATTAAAARVLSCLAVSLGESAGKRRPFLLVGNRGELSLSGDTLVSPAVEEALLPVEGQCCILKCLFISDSMKAKFTN